MGVKELWGILAQAKQEIPLENLKGQTIAVDLSVWICENNGVKAVQGRVVKPHLRNLFFRVSNLLQLGVKLIFVIDGEAPDLKWETISNRINARFPGRGSSKSGGGNPNQKSSRSHFKSLIRECTEMLDFLGVPYVQSQGEAEAMCALLNQQGIVDACITEDGDAFLYGARWVYRNFNLASRDPMIASYKMTDIEDLGYNRETLVALAMLLGCDFVPKGVPGVGKVHAVNLISHLGGENILGRFRDWAKGDVAFQKSLPDKPSHCSRCHHVGSAQNHRNGGCPQCGGMTSCAATKKPTPCTCAWHCAKEEFDKSSLERDIMTKATNVPGFPQQGVIDEFLVTKDVCPRGSMERTRPHMVHLMKFALKKLGWHEEYTRSKVIELVTLYDLEVPSRSGPNRDPLVVDHIVKKRIRSGVPCLEVAWVLPESWQLEGEESNVISTIERLDLLRAAQPAVIADFEAMEINKKSRKRGQPGRKAAKASKDSTDSADDNTTDTEVAALTRLDAVITDRLSKMNLQSSSPLDGSQEAAVVEDELHQSKDQHSSNKPPTTSSGEQGEEVKKLPDDQSGPGGDSDMPSLRERLQSRGRRPRGVSKECYKTDEAICIVRDDDVGGSIDPGPVVISHVEWSERSKMKADAEDEEVGRSSLPLPEVKNSHMKGGVNIGDGMMDGPVLDISSDQEYSSSDVRGTTIDLCDVMLSDLSHEEISVVSGHIQGQGSRKKPDLAIHEGNVIDQRDFIFPPQDDSKASEGVDCSVMESFRSVNFRTSYSTFPAPQEVDTPDVTQAEESLEVVSKRRLTSDNPHDNQTVGSGENLRLSLSHQHPSDANPEAAPLVDTRGKMLNASTLHQMLLLKQMAASSRRGRSGTDEMAQKSCSRREETVTISLEEESSIVSSVHESAGLESTEVYDIITPDTSVADQEGSTRRKKDAADLSFGVFNISDVDGGDCCADVESKQESTVISYRRGREAVVGAFHSGSSTDSVRKRTAKTPHPSAADVDAVLTNQECVTGMDAEGIDVLSRGTTPEPTLIDIETPYQTPLQTPTQTPMAGTSRGPEISCRHSHPQTPPEVDTSSTSSQFVSFSCDGHQSPGIDLSGSPASFLTADFHTPASVRLSASNSISVRSSPGLLATPESSPGVDRSQDHSMFQVLNFSLETSLWSPWNSLMIGCSNQPSGGEGIPANESNSRLRMVTKPGSDIGPKSYLEMDEGKGGHVSLMKNSNVTEQHGIANDDTEDLKRDFAAEKLGSPTGGSSPYSPGVYIDRFESPDTSPLIENLLKVLNMELVEADTKQRTSQDCSKVLRNCRKEADDKKMDSCGKSEEAGKCTTGDILKEQRSPRRNANDVRRGMIPEKVGNSMECLQGQGKERQGLLDLSSQMERLRINAEQETAELSAGRGRVAVGMTKDLNIQQERNRVFSLADKENSPVSLMDRLRKRSVRHRNILKSMDLEQ